jgi:hypothetical protein
MNCTDFEREQIEWVAARDRKLSDAARAHLATCADCRRLWQADWALDGMIVTWRKSLPATMVGGRVLAVLRQDRPSPAGPVARPMSGVPWALVAAVGVLLCLGLTLWRDSGSDRRTVARHDPEAPLPITDSVVSLWDGVQMRSQQAAEETVRRLDDFPQVALQETISPSALPTTTEATELTTSARPWLEWSEPLGRQVGQAFRFLGDALPDPNDRPAG